MNTRVIRFPECLQVEYPNSTGSTIPHDALKELADGRLGVICGDILDGKTGVASTRGVYRVPKSTSQAFTKGDSVYFNGTNAVPFTGASGQRRHGTAYEDAATSATTMLLDINNEAPGVSRLVKTQSNPAESTEVATATTSAQPFDLTQTIPGGFLKAGDTVVNFQDLRQTGKNSTNTARWQIYANSTLIADSGGSLDLAAGADSIANVRLSCRSAGATGKIYVSGFICNGTNGNLPTPITGVGEITLDTTADIVITSKITFSAASASNKAKLAVHEMQYFRAG